MNPLSPSEKLKRAFLSSVAIGGLLLISGCGEDNLQDQPTNDSATTPESGEPLGQDASQEGDAAGTFTMDQVEQNDSPESCWAVIGDTVYDLTDWIEDHPGGAERIESLCGTSAGEGFESQHGGQEGPAAQLAEFEIGTLTENAS